MPHQGQAPNQVFLVTNGYGPSAGRYQYQSKSGCRVAALHGTAQRSKKRSRRKAGSIPREIRKFDEYSALALMNQALIAMN
jgi:hypothetical protein